MHEFPIIEVGGFRVDIAALIAITITSIIVFVLVMLSVRKLSVDKPSKLQNFMEWVVEFVHNTIASTMPLKHAVSYISLGMTLMIFIFVGNVLGLPFGLVFEYTEVTSFLGFDLVTQAALEEHHGEVHMAWWKSPTADLAVTFGLASIVFFLVHFLGFKKNRKHYIKHYFQPFWFFFPLNIIETLSKPLTLGLRLFANIFAGEVLIATILMMGWFGIPLLAVWQGFSLFVGAIQAFLFTILTMVYISQAAIHEEH